MATITKSGLAKIDRAISVGWTPDELTGPCKFWKLHRERKREMRRRRGQPQQQPLYK